MKAANWPLAASMKKAGVSYHPAIDAWVARHRPFTVIYLVSFHGARHEECRGPLKSGLGRRASQQQ